MRIRIRVGGVAAAVVGAAVLAGCEPPLEVPETYSFMGRTGLDSVAYGGQALRQVLIEDMKADLGTMTSRIDQGTYTPAAGAVKARLEFFYRFDGSTSGDVAPLLATTPPVKQTRYSEVTASANLSGKIAGKDDPQKQHKDWSTQFRGWAGAASPDALVVSWFEELDELAAARANGSIPLDPSGAPISKVHVTADGRDLRELLQKFLGGAVSFSQGTDDYLDDTLSADHAAVEEGKPYTTLEHAWDEAFGYFGASRDYLERTDAQLAASPAADVDGDGKIDLLSEYSFGHSANASKRDAASAASAPTDFSGDAIKAFLKGRAILAAARGPLTADQRAALEEQRDLAVRAWENAIAASVVHYMNQVLVDMGKFGTSGYSFADHAKHWSEMKGFALSLQFNPRSPLPGASFESLHQKLGDHPVLPNAGAGEISAYRTAILEARGLLRDAYGFAAANVGDESGLNGW